MMSPAWSEVNLWPASHSDGKERTIQHMMMTTFWHPDGTPCPRGRGAEKILEWSAADSVSSPHEYLQPSPIRHHFRARTAAGRRGFRATAHRLCRHLHQREEQRHLRVSHGH